jgi:hypothetical protein
VILSEPFNSDDQRFRASQAPYGGRSYFVIESPLAAGKPYVREFTAWLIEEVKRDAERDGTE